MILFNMGLTHLASEAFNYNLIFIRSRLFLFDKYNNLAPTSVEFMILGINRYRWRVLNKVVILLFRICFHILICWENQLTRQFLLSKNDPGSIINIMRHFLLSYEWHVFVITMSWLNDSWWHLLVDRLSLISVTFILVSKYLVYGSWYVLILKFR